MQPHPIPLRSLAVENLTVGRMEPVRFIEEAGAAGFGAVGLPLATATPGPLMHEIVGRPEVIRAIKAALRATGVRVFDVEAFVLSPDARIESYRPVLEAGAELGASHISAIGAPVQDKGVDATATGRPAGRALRGGGGVWPACRGRVHALP